MFAKMTLTGLETLMQPMNKSIFDNLELPAGIDKDAVINMIYLRGGDYPVTYTDPLYVYNSLKGWSLAHYRTFEKWVKALDTEYAPLENYDRIEEISDVSNGYKSGNETGTDNITTSHTNTRSYNDNEQGSDTEIGRESDNKSLTRTENLTGTDKRTNAHNISAYNSTTDYVKDFEDVSNDETSNNNTITENGNTIAETNKTSTNSVNKNGSGTDTNVGTDQKHAYKTASENSNETRTRTAKIHGNIGVTTSQQMLESELKIAQWNLYEHIADAFISDYCIPIYI